MRNIPSLSHGFLSRLTCIPLVPTEMLPWPFLLRRPIHHDPVQRGFQQFHIMSLGSAYD
jgi:hypothetical protein